MSASPIPIINADVQKLADVHSSTGASSMSSLSTENEASASSATSATSNPLTSVFIYATSSDLMRLHVDGPCHFTLHAVPSEHEFGKNGCWDAVRGTIVGLLDNRDVQVTCVDFLGLRIHDSSPTERCMGTNNTNDKTVDNHDEQCSYIHPLIHIGVLPGTLSGELAELTASDICALLDKIQATDVDIGFSQSTMTSFGKRSQGPALFPPFTPFHILQTAGPLSTTLGIPISERKASLQGTLGPYFHVGDKLYAITCRHNIASLINHDNDEYRYHPSAPKKEVVLMNDHAFVRHLESIQKSRSKYVESLGALNVRIQYLEAKLDAKNPEHTTSKEDLEEHLSSCDTLQQILEETDGFLDILLRHWRQEKDRIIGFVVWAPPIRPNVPPNGYTEDFCVIELDKLKFKNMVGNVLNLESRTNLQELANKVSTEHDILAQFQQPPNNLLTLREILTVEEVPRPPQDSMDSLLNVVVKRGSTTNLTIGVLSTFKSYVRKYDMLEFSTGITIPYMESIELPVLTPGFSKCGDSGALVASVMGKYVGIITGGPWATLTPSLDVTYITPFYWIWQRVKQKYQGAKLGFSSGDIERLMKSVS